MKWAAVAPIWAKLGLSCIVFCGESDSDTFGAQFQAKTAKNEKNLDFVEIWRFVCKKSHCQKNVDFFLHVHVVRDACKKNSINVIYTYININTSMNMNMNMNINMNMNMNMNMNININVY